MSLAIEQSGGAGLEPGALYLDEVHAVTPGGRVRVEEFGAAAGVAVIEDALIAVADALHLEAGPARLAGESPTAAFTWGTTGLGSTHGVSFGETRSASAPMPALASKTALEQEGLEHGDRIALSIASHRIPIEIVETAEFFPTLDPFEQGFLVLDLDGLLRTSEPRRPRAGLAAERGLGEDRARWPRAGALHRGHRAVDGAGRN